MSQAEEENPFVVILTQSQDERLGLEALLAGFGLACETVDDQPALERTLNQKACSGVFLSIPTLLRMQNNDKDYIISLESVYPVARFRRTQDGSVVVMSSYTGVTPGLDDFVAICRAWPKRRMRSSERHRKSLNLRLTRVGKNGRPRTTKSFTLDVATNGCFAYTEHSWKVGDHVVLEFVDGKAPLAVEGTVRRLVVWGQPFHAPGIGIQFAVLDESLRLAMTKLIKQLR